MGTTIPQCVCQVHVIPLASQADLDHPHIEFAKFARHLRQSRWGNNLPCSVTEVIAVDVTHMPQTRLLAARTRPRSGIPETLSRPKQVRLRVDVRRVFIICDGIARKDVNNGLLRDSMVDHSSRGRRVLNGVSRAGRRAIRSIQRTICTRPVAADF